MFTISDITANAHRYYTLESPDPSPTNGCDLGTADSPAVTRGAPRTVGVHPPTDVTLSSGQMTGPGDVAFGAGASAYSHLPAEQSASAAPIWQIFRRRVVII